MELAFVLPRVFSVIWFCLFGFIRAMERKRTWLCVFACDICFIKYLLWTRCQNPDPIQSTDSCWVQRVLFWFPPRTVYFSSCLCLSGLVVVFFFLLNPSFLNQLFLFSAPFLHQLFSFSAFLTTMNLIILRSVWNLASIWNCSTMFCLFWFYARA